jgi:phosphoribosylformylglycinamidine synthase
MSLYQKRSLPFELLEIKLQGASDKQLVQISTELGVGLNLKEMKSVQKYFSEKGRNPTDVELQTIGQTWSEHCYHKTFKGEITLGKKKIKSLFKTYIAKATKELNPS